MFSVRSALTSTISLFSYGILTLVVAPNGGWKDFHILLRGLSGDRIVHMVFLFTLFTLLFTEIIAINH